MKKIRILIVAVTIAAMMLGTVASAFEAAVWDDGTVEEGTTEAPFFEQQRGTRYNPWLVNYHIQQPDEAVTGMHGGEGYQQISDIAVSPVDEDLIIIGTDTSGVWRSEDGGEHWFAVSNGINTWGTTDICFHPTKRNVAYMLQSGPNESDATAQGMNRTKLDGLYKSVDGGRNWRQILHAPNLGCTTTSRLIVFDEAENIYVMTAEGLIKSTDEGKTWSFVCEFEKILTMDDGVTKTNLTNYDLCVRGDYIVFTNEQYGVFASFDGGATWQRRNVDGVTEVNVAPAFGLDIDPDDPDHWLACFGGTYREVYETKDAGLNWTRLSTGATDINDTERPRRYPIKVLFGERYNGNEYRTIYMLFRYTYNPFRRSVDGGKTWEATKKYTNYNGSSYESAYYGHGIQLISSTPGTLYFCGGRVMKSTDDGQNFYVCNPGYSGGCARNFEFSSSGKLYATILDRGVYVTEDVYDSEDLPSLIYLNGGNYGDVGIDPRDEEHIIYANAPVQNTSYELGHITADNQTWTKFEGTETQTDPFNLIEFHKDNENIVYTTHYTSYDKLATWTENSKKIQAVSPVDNDIVYSVEKVEKGANLYKSVDCGRNWEVIYASTDREITEVFCDISDKDTVWIGRLDGEIVKLRNVDGGTTEATVYDEDNGLSNIIPRAIIQNPKDAKHLLAGGEVGDLTYLNNIYRGYTKSNLYETRDGGENWYIVKGLPSVRAVYAMAFSPNSTEVIFGGFTGGIMIYDYEAYRKAVNADFITVSDLDLSEGNTLTATAKVTNSGTEEKSINMIIAQYDGTTLVKADTKSEAVSAGVTDMTVSASTDAHDKANVQKVFIWNNLSQLKPLYNFE